MTEHSDDFATLLQRYMARALRTNRDLAHLTGIALRTIENWTLGEVRRPRVVADVLKLARALALDLSDTDALLRAALAYQQRLNLEERRVLEVIPAKPPPVA